MLWIGAVDYGHTFSETGYSEAAEQREEAQALSIKIAVSVAMVDGTLADSEGETIKAWVMRAIGPYPKQNRERLKNLYNEAFKEAFSQVLDGTLNLSNITSRLNEIGEKKVKYDAIELCFDVMAADGKIDAEEMRMIRKVAEALTLNLDEIERIKDHRIIKLDVAPGGDIPTEEILGIQESWDREHVKKHLREEFQKWNNRINTLPEGEERANAQKMLDLIAEVRKKSA